MCLHRRAEIMIDRQVQLLHLEGLAFGNADADVRAHATLALPKGLTYFSTLHTELTDVPKGTHLLPKVNFEAQELPQKKNVRILLLSPVPFKTSALISGREKEILDGDTFDGATVYSTVGFLSYLNGERIATNGTFGRK